MKKHWSLAVLLVLSALPAHALDSRIAKQLDALAPDERREQRCDLEAIDRIFALSMNPARSVVR